MKQGKNIEKKMSVWVTGRSLIKQEQELKWSTFLSQFCWSTLLLLLLLLLFGSYLGPRLELGVVVGVEGGVARQREEPSLLSPPLRTSSMICSHVSGRLVGFVVT